jgi:hypothetical protein
MQAKAASALPMHSFINLHGQLITFVGLQLSATSTQPEWVTLNIIAGTQVNLDLKVLFVV